MLQLDPSVLKSKIRSSEITGEKTKLRFAIFMRAILIVLFAILFVAPIGTIFGSENSSMGVAFFCILLSIRFVDFSYCIKDSVINLGLTFTLLLVAPIVAYNANPLLAGIIHFCAFFAILLMTADKPEMGNGGLYGFSYVFLTGNTVTGQAFLKRCELTLIGFCLFGIIFYFKHREKNKDVRFKDVFKKFDMSNEKCRWQFRMALALSIVLTVGNALNLERFMWAGFACISMLSAYPYTVKVLRRSMQRMIGIAVGSLMFFVVYQLTPVNMQTLLGPIGGFCLGFCTDYRKKTAINCFGALMLAASIYGARDAVLLRIYDNFLGVILGMIIIYLFYVLVDMRFIKKKENI